MSSKLNTVIFSFILLGTITSPAYAASDSIPENAKTFNGHSYVIVDTATTWDEANNYCKNAGGYLLTINSPEEQQFINQLLSEGKKNNYWLGGQRKNLTDFEWINGEAFNYTNWASPYEPNNFDSRGDNVLMIYKNNNPSYGIPNSLGQWNDIASDGVVGNESFFGKDNFGYICEWDSVHVRKNALEKILSPLINLLETLHNAIFN